MAVSVFLKLGKFKGESLDDKHKDWIDILSWSWGMTQSGTTHLGPGAGSGKVNVQDITMVKYVDMATNELLKACAAGNHIPDATIEVCKASGADAPPIPYLKIELTEVMITSYQTGGGGDGLDRVTETLGLNFAEYKVTYTSQNPDGTPGPAATAGFNIPVNKPV